MAMPTFKSLTAGIGCAVVFGMLAASGVPTRMNPAPEPHWRLLPAVQPPSQSAPAYIAESEPIDVSPDVHPALVSNEGQRERLAEIGTHDFNRIGLEDIALYKPEPLPETIERASASLDAKEAAAAAKIAALAVNRALSD